MKYLIQFWLTLCCLLLTIPAIGQRKPRIKGNRNVILVDKPLSSFSHLVLADDLELWLKPGEEEAVRIEADDNLIDVLRFETDGDTLIVSSFYNITSSKKLGLTLQYHQLESIKVTAGMLRSDEALRSDQMDLHLSGMSKASLEVQAGYTTLRMEDKASADLRLEGDSLTLELYDQSDANIYISNESMALSLSNQSSLNLEGISQTAKAVLKDNTSFKSVGLEVQEMIALLQDSSNGRIRAVTSLAYEGRGNSRLFVYGEPRIEIIGFYDRAELHKEPE